jgi:Conjugative transposon protein TcpC
VAERAATQPRPVVRRESLALVRARARAPKTVLFAFVAFFALLGLRVALAGPPKPPPAPRSADPLVGAQVDATGFAQGFARAYLTYDSAAPQLHEQALRPYIAGLDDPDAGFAVPNHGKRSVVWTAPVAAARTAPDTTLVTVAAAYDASARLDYLAVPVTRLPSGQLAVASLPGLVGAPPLAARYQAALGDDIADPQLADVVRRALSNYLAGARQNLAADLDRGAQVTVPPRPLALEDVSSLTWQRPGVVLATVAVRDAQRLSFSLRYGLAVVKRDRWFVRALNPAVPTTTTEGAIR